MNARNAWKLKKKKGKKERESFENGLRQIVVIFNAPSRIPSRERMSRNRSRSILLFNVFHFDASARKNFLLKDSKRK